MLGTEAEPALVDTIVMANLGYFQLKARPGAFALALAQGRSRELYAVNDSTPGAAPKVRTPCALIHPSPEAPGSCHFCTHSDVTDRYAEYRGGHARPGVAGKQHGIRNNVAHLEEER